MSFILDRIGSVVLYLIGYNHKVSRDFKKLRKEDHMMTGLSQGVLPTFYTAKQVGAMLHMRSDSVVRKIRRGQWKGMKRGNLWLIERAAVEELLRELRGQS